MAFLDSSGVTRLWQHIIAKLGNKVDKETGKGLSTNDYTTTEKNKLAGIAEGANNYTLPVASSTLGGVRTTNTDELDLLTANGYAPIPIVDGIPYFMPVSVLENDGFHYLTVGNLDLKIYNKGILSLSQGTTNGTIKYTWFNQQVNNTVTSDLKIKGLDTAAYHPESYFVPATRTINNKALSANISLTASDVGAAASSHTHSYLPLSGGALTGSLTVNNNIYSKGTLVSQTNNYPEVHFKNAAGTTLAEFYVDTTSGGYADTVLKVSSDASTNKYFTFGRSGVFGMPDGFSAQMGEFKTNAWPQLFFRNRNGNNLAQLVVPTNNGSYSGLAVNIYSDASNHVEYKFNSTGVFQAPSWIQGAALVAKANDYPRLNLKNSSGTDLSQLYADTSTGAYSDTVLKVCKDASSASFFIFGKNGTFRTDAGITTIGNYISIKNNSYPQFIFINTSGADIGKVFVATTDGSYAATKIRAYSSASSYYDFQFLGNGTFNCATLAPSNALGIAYGGTGATTASGALTNLGALPLTGGTLTGNLGVNGIITAKTYLAVERNSNPQLALKNANSNPLAVLYTETSDGSYGNTHLQVYKSATESTTFTFGNTGNFRAYGNIYGSTLQVDGANNWPSLWFKCSSKTNPGVLLQTNELHGFGIYCYGSDLDTATTRYFEGYTFPAPATGLTANKTYTVYSEKNIIYSSSQPTGVKGAIWLKPV